MTPNLTSRFQAMTSSFRIKAVAYSHQQLLFLTHSRKLTGPKFLTKTIRSNVKSVLLNNYLVIHLRVFRRVSGECQKILQRWKRYFVFTLAVSNKRSHLSGIHNKTYLIERLEFILTISDTCYQNLPLWYKRHYFFEIRKVRFPGNCFTKLRFFLVWSLHVWRDSHIQIRNNLLEKG